MPQLGESVAEGTIGRWLKKPGDRVVVKVLRGVETVSATVTLGQRGR